MCLSREELFFRADCLYAHRNRVDSKKESHEVFEIQLIVKPLIVDNSNFLSHCNAAVENRIDSFLRWSVNEAFCLQVIDPQPLTLKYKHLYRRQRNKRLAATLAMFCQVKVFQSGAAFLFLLQSIR